MLSDLRNGNFTSSEIYRLMKKGTVQTYIDECNRERRLGRSISIESDARPLTWGKCTEMRAFRSIGLEYTFHANTSIVHPDYNFWVGTPDATTSDKLAEIKCPITLTSFCNLVDPVIEIGHGEPIIVMEGIEAVRKNHKDGDKYYWQCVSNAILTKKEKAQLIVYVPYLDELDEIKTLADGDPRFYWIWASENEKLPYLLRGGHYKNVNVIEFDIPKSDVDALTERVYECGKQLIKI